MADGLGYADLPRAGSHHRAVADEACPVGYDIANHDDDGIGALRVAVGRIDGDPVTCGDRHTLEGASDMASFDR